MTAVEQAMGRMRNVLEKAGPLLRQDKLPVEDYAKLYLLFNIAASAAALVYDELYEAADVLKIINNQPRKPIHAKS